MSLAISPDGSNIVSGSQDYTIKIWDVDTGKCIKTLAQHTLCVVSLVITWMDRKLYLDLGTEVSKSAISSQDNV